MRRAAGHKTLCIRAGFRVDIRPAIRHAARPPRPQKAKNYLALQLPRNFETERDVAASLAQLYLHNLPADYYATYADRVRAVTVDEVKRAADKYIQPDKFAVVIVGDRKVIEAGVRALSLGPLTVVGASEIFK